ncbi:hypothetical protein Riv7116_4818 [Rivularia sp. PCC 7116]|uniref:DUF4278 domain-containing protein n=1 Tax=Rivularia sp. PCC 7116 TaxID=373994 RepID=UPI00029ED31E|nr:DUF4278 domain-containing protein [Rivularia sp. PCC 7116]AFY57230.1 hypothetical protein Riv7116_4818 [Rivularia sp. PCC 7116]
MFLTYRGLSYERNSSASKTVETNRFAIYRGIAYCIHRSIVFKNNQFSRVLMYGGIPYFRN